MIAKLTPVGAGHRWLSKSALILSAAAIGFVTLWIAGFSPQWLFRHRSSPDRVVAKRIAPLTAPSRVVSPTPEDLATVFPGIDSSISKVAQPLILTGTLLGRNSHDGFAFIGVNERNPQTYAAGAILANGARLAEIGKDHVVLERDGKSAILYSQNIKDRAGVQRAHSDLLMVGGPQHFTPAVATDSDPITNVIRPSPVYEGEVLVGYQVYAGHDVTTFAKLGLQPGDVITALDGEPLGDTQAAMEMLRQLTSGISLAATVKRKNAVEHVTLDGSIVVTELNRADQAAAQTIDELPSS